MSAILFIQRSDGSMQEWPLEQSETVLGRDQSCDVIVDVRLISRQHAVIRRDQRCYLIQDLDSRNGTTVNGQPVSHPVVLHDGDQIELGGVCKCTFVDNDSTKTRPIPGAIGISLDTATQDVWVNGQRLVPPLSLAQFRLLDVLSSRIDQLCSRDEMIAAVWPDITEGVSDEALDALIKRVRARLGEVPNGQGYLRTVRGRGLILRSKPE